MEVAALSWLSLEELCCLSPLSKGVRAAVVACLDRTYHMKVTRPDGVPESIIRYCRRLRSIRVTWLAEGHPSILTLAAANAATLTSLDHIGVKAPNLLDTITLCRDLRRLILPSVQLSTEETRQLVRACPRLEEVNAWEIDYGVLLLASPRLPLRKLGSLAGPYLSPRHIEPFLCHTTLEEIEFFSLQHLSRIELRRLILGLAQRLPNLRRLTLALSVPFRKEAEAVEHGGGGQLEDAEEEDAIVFTQPLQRLDLLTAILGAGRLFTFSGPRVEGLELTNVLEVPASLQGNANRSPQPSLCQLAEAFPSLTSLRETVPSESSFVSQRDAAALDDRTCAFVVVTLNSPRFLSGLASERKTWERLETLGLQRVSRTFLSRVLFSRFPALRRLSLCMDYSVLQSHICAILTGMQRLEGLTVRASYRALGEAPPVEEVQADEKEDSRTRALFSPSPTRLVEHRALRYLKLMAVRPSEMGQLEEEPPLLVDDLFRFLWLPGLRRLKLSELAGQFDVTAILQRSCPAVEILTVDDCEEATYSRPHPPLWPAAALRRVFSDDDDLMRMLRGLA